MGCVLAEDAAFSQGLHNQRDVALLEIAYAAVDEFGAPARGALAEVVSLQQEGSIATCGGVEGNTHAGGPSSDDDDTPGFRFRPGPGQHLMTVHARALLGALELLVFRVGAACSHSLARSRASDHLARRARDWSCDIRGLKTRSIFH